MVMFGIMSPCLWRQVWQLGGHNLRTNILEYNAACVRFSNKLYYYKYNCLALYISNILFLYVNLLIDGSYMLYRYQNYLTEASSKRLLDALNPVSREDQVTYTLRCLTLKRQKSTNRALERRKNLRICCWETHQQPFLLKVTLIEVALFF